MDHFASQRSKRWFGRTCSRACCGCAAWSAIRRAPRRGLLLPQGGARRVRRSWRAARAAADAESTAEAPASWRRRDPRARRAVRASVCARLGQPLGDHGARGAVPTRVDPVAPAVELVLEIGQCRCGGGARNPGVCAVRREAPRQAEAASRRTISDWQASVPAKQKEGASVTTGVRPRIRVDRGPGTPSLRHLGTLRLSTRGSSCRTARSSRCRHRPGSRAPPRAPVHDRGRR